MGGSISDENIERIAQKMVLDKILEVGTSHRRKNRGLFGLFGLTREEPIHYTKIEVHPGNPLPVHAIQTSQDLVASSTAPSYIFVKGVVLPDSIGNQLDVYGNPDKARRWFFQLCQIHDLKLDRWYK